MLIITTVQTISLIRKWKGKMNMSPVCKKIYLVWIDQETWYTAHPLDKRRFYNFVSVYLQYSRKNISSTNLKEDIILRYKGKLDNEYLEDRAEYYSCLFDELVDYVRFSKRVAGYF